MYAPPVADTTQNVESISGSVANGRTTVTFTRARVTGDTQDFDFNDGNCAHFLFAWGGSVQADGNILKHNDQRTVSSQKFCFTSCDVPGNINRFSCFSFFNEHILDALRLG